MARLIDIDALVAEIESKKKCFQTLGDNAINSSMQQFYDGMKQGCVDILSFIDTIEVKEVDLDFQMFAKEMRHGMITFVAGAVLLLVAIILPPECICQSSSGRTENS